MSRETKIPAQLESRIELSDGLAIFRFALESDFSFAPGQYATLWLTHRGKTLVRPYTIVSSPSEARVLEFYINLVREGKLTPSLWQSEVIEGLRRRDRETKAAITGPKGRFVLDADDLRDMVCIASGTGLAPFVSMIRHLNEECSSAPKLFRPRKVYLIHGVSYPSHLGYREEMEKLAAESVRDPKRKFSLIYFPTISRPFIDSSWAGLIGRAENIFNFSAISKSGALNLEDAVRSMLGAVMRPETHVIYVCGHAGTVDNIVEVFSRRGFKLDVDIKLEKYYPS
jgi:ferredoxin/flavodoxin---NADP+ reductase